MQLSTKITLVPDKALLKEVTKELWLSVKKLRPELDKDPRMQLVLKALITIGDLPNPIEAAMVVAVCLEMEEQDETDVAKKESPAHEQSAEVKEPQEARRTVRRRSTAG